MNNSETELSQIESERGLRTLKEVVNALSFAVGALSSAQQAENGDGLDFYEAVRRCEIMLIKRALTKTRGNQAQAARILKLKQTTLHGKIKKYRISPSVLLYREGDSLMEAEHPRSFQQPIENVS